MKTYAWDELGGEIVAVTTPDQQSGDWERRPDEGKVRVFHSSRGHVALEVEAHNAHEAHLAFLVNEYYRENHE